MGLLRLPTPATKMLIIAMHLVFPAPGICADAVYKVTEHDGGSDGGHVSIETSNS